jgi:hypothetical protein
MRQIGILGLGFRYMSAQETKGVFQLPYAGFTLAATAAVARVNARRGGPG